MRRTMMTARHQVQLRLVGSTGKRSSGASSCFLDRQRLLRDLASSAGNALYWPVQMKMKGDGKFLSQQVVLEHQIDTTTECDGNSRRAE